MELGVGAHEYSLTYQIPIGWKHHAICWLVWWESACDALLLIGHALGWWAWSAHDHCMHSWRENAGELEMTESTLFWQLRANYTQKKCPTPQPVTLGINIIFLSYSFGLTPLIISYLILCAYFYIILTQPITFLVCKHWSKVFLHALLHKNVWKLINTFT